jgi:hypothetical protein
MDVFLSIDGLDCNHLFKIAEAQPTNVLIFKSLGWKLYEKGICINSQVVN